MFWGKRNIKLLSNTHYTKMYDATKFYNKGDEKDILLLVEALHVEPHKIFCHVATCFQCNFLCSNCKEQQQLKIQMKQKVCLHKITVVHREVR